VGSRSIIDSYFARDRGKEFSFETTATIRGIEDVDVIVTYEGIAHSDEDRKLTGQVGEVKIVRVNLKGPTMSGPNKLEVMDGVDPESFEKLEGEALEHFSEHHNDDYDLRADDEGD
jgi:hypothetical protein